MKLSIVIRTLLLCSLSIAFLLLWSSSVAQQKQPAATFFRGNKVSFAMPPVDSEGLANGPVIVCVESTPKPQCYTPPEANPPFGTAPKAKVVQLKPGIDVILYEVHAYAGGSGSRHLLALLEPDKGYLSNLTPDTTFGDQSEYHFWNVPSISDMPLLVLADASSGPGETHFDKHRFLVTVYSFVPEWHSYSLRDKYLTSGKYPSFNDVDVINVLEPEREEIVARLKRQH